MFTKVLIANRGEIACRIIRTLDRLGVASVAVYSEADRHAPHVRLAGEAVCVGPAPAASSYLQAEKILAAARDTGAQAIHPGYGFLSENADFADACEAAGIAFIGPTAKNMRDFGLKHTARALAIAAGVPVSPGTDLLETVAEAALAAERIGYPVMIKSTAGGGGIGMQLARTPAELALMFESVQRLARSNFKAAGLFLEKYVASARHVEVQIFGDGAGEIAVLGERDCSAQRRNQKVLEETPAPGLSDDARRLLHDSARNLGRAANYRSAGTCEFMYDADTGAVYFLEVNTRLQVEHCVTEEVSGLDLVEWMVRLAAGESLSLTAYTHAPQGHAIEARVYAEEANKNFQPSCGVLTEVAYPEGVRIDGWVERGSEVTPFYDPMVAKVIAHAPTREQAIDKLYAALGDTTLAGIETNVEYLRAILADPAFRRGGITTKHLATFDFTPQTVDVLEPGTHTTVQDYPGRTGYWEIGVPPSGPMDHLAHRLANALLGNDPAAATLECTVTGPRLQFHIPVTLCLTGADMQPELDGLRQPLWRPFHVQPGQQLKLYPILGPGCRTYIAIQGGWNVPDYLGSKSTFTLGQFGGHAGRILRTGDVLKLAPAIVPNGRDGRPWPSDDSLSSPINQPPVALETRGGGGANPRPIDYESIVPTYTSAWTIDVLYGPHGAPDFFTDDDIATFFATDWQVHYNSSRTGIRLIGPKPQWARTDGGEAGLHPSNIHDNAYAIGAIDFTGDMPVILAVDGPSLGGFVCPATIVQSELWKIGQLRPGDTIRFQRTTEPAATAAERAQDQLIQNATALAHEGRAGFSEPADESNAAPSEPTPPETRAHASESPPPEAPAHSAIRNTEALGALGIASSEGTAPIGGETSGSERGNPQSAILATLEANGDNPAVTYRQSGDRAILVEYGPLQLDLNLRFCAHALQDWLLQNPQPGLLDLTPGIRSLQVHYDPRILPREKLLAILIAAEKSLPPLDSIEIPTRIVHLPLSWDDPATRLAIDKYQQSVRRDAPWCPSNIEFIRRINGLASIDEVRNIVYSARYLVLGLGDVYLGAPVATPLDPRHRLVTTKYNPARTWTPENAVGIGGAYLCVYGMEGPGGYQFVGRTLQMWNRWRQTADFPQPWLLRHFDQIQFYPVSEAELLQLREDFPTGRHQLRIEHTTFRLADYRAFLQSIEPTATAFKEKQQAAFHAERERWAAAGVSEESAPADLDAPDSVLDLPDGATPIDSHVAANVWQVHVKPGDHVNAGDTLLILEAMKMEIAVTAPVAGTIHSVRCTEGQMVMPGQTVAVIE